MARRGFFSSEASGPCACGRGTCARKTNDATLLQARQQMNRRQHPRRAKLQSSLEASGPCACGRSTCARKTNDATLLQSRQQMNRRQHPRRAKLQSAWPIAPSWTCSASPARSRSRALPVIAAGTCPFIQNVTAPCMVSTESEGDLSIRHKSSATVRDHIGGVGLHKLIIRLQSGTAEAHHQSDCEATWSSSSPVSKAQTAPSAPTPVVAKTLAHSADGLSAEEYLYDSETDEADKPNPTISGQRLGRETRLNRFCRT